ncbi:hypothetical protein, partial [Staphylococcus aureus]|uniref:hypothetical protein n=1 Tax=Staphylococcus aureus TaxID=1280 RepID=UPI001CEF61A2
RKSNVSYLKCVAFFSFIRLNNSHISSKVTQMASNFENDALVNNTHLSQTIILIIHTTLAIS